MTLLQARLIEEITAHGPIPVARFMESALSDKQHGYYFTRDPFGTAGDFTTAPEISQIFGELIGAWCAERWHALGRPECALVELGPGRGTLLRDALHATRRIEGFHAHLSVHLVETSPALRRIQRETLQAHHPLLQWHDGLETLPHRPALIIANEFFDALPVHQYEYTRAGWRERMVGCDPLTHSLCFVADSAPVASAIAAMLESYPPPREGAIAEINIAAREAMHTLAAHIKRHGGGAFIADYGYPGPVYGDTLQAVKAHRPHPPLIEAGSADLTAHVDFSALRHGAQSEGLAVFGPAPQGSVLEALGARERLAALCHSATPQQAAQLTSGLNRLISVQEMGQLFKIMAVQSPHLPPPAGW